MDIKVLSVSYSEVPTERITKNVTAPRKFKGVCAVTTDDGKHLRVEVEAETTSTGPALRSLQVEPADQSQHLRSQDVRVPVGTILEQIAKHVTYRETAPPNGSTLEFVASHARDRLGGTTQGKIYRRTSGGEMESIEIDWERLRARPGKLDRAHYKSWAKAYKEVMKTTKRPIKKLHERTGIPKSTIGRYIVKARVMGLLPRTTDGKAQS
jgi:hypothetical protein